MAASATSSTLAVDDAIAWQALPASGVPMPHLTTPASPAPSAADGLAGCRAGDLTADSALDGAMGVRLVLVTFTGRPGVRCRLSGSPRVVVHATGRSAPVPSTHADFLPEQAYRHPVAVDDRHPAVLTVWWPSNWCIAPVIVTGLDIVLPGGRLSAVGFGPSVCAATGGTAPGQDVTGGQQVNVGTFAPQDWTPQTVTSPLTGATLALDTPPTTTSGTGLEGTLTVTTATDITLTPCPDLTLALGNATAWWTQRYALDCAALAARDPGAVPTLHAGVPARFRVVWQVPAAATGPLKVTVALDPPDGPATATAATIAR